MVVVFAFRWDGNAVTWSYENTGQFGDSFGILGTIMAACAAYFAYRTYQAQSEETRLLRVERAEAAKLRAEPSYLNLLERRYSTIDQFIYRPGSASHTGIAGLDAMAGQIEWRLKSYGTNPLNAYSDIVKDAKNISHLFRFTYHIVRYAERHFDGYVDDARTITRKDLSYHYVSLLRSQISESELVLLALNVLTPDGEGAKRLYERYALFHNLSEDGKKMIKSAGTWDDRAFGLPPEASVSD